MNDDDYVLPRDASESIRLTAQHYITTQRQGYLLHPTVMAHIESTQNPQIADVATGTGTVAFELANTIPNAQVTGLDISSAQYPPRRTWLDNCQFSLYDVLQPVPETLKEKFDVVHMRFLLTGALRVDKAIIIERLWSLLKPGGYLQWIELQWPSIMGTSSFIPHGVVPSESLKLFKAHPTALLIDKVIGFSSNIGWFEDFVSTFQQAGGWQNVLQDNIPVNKGLLAAETMVGEASTSKGLRFILEKGLVKDAELIEKMKTMPAHLDELRAEGYLWTYNLSVGVARKTGS